MRPGIRRAPSRSYLLSSFRRRVTVLSRSTRGKQPSYRVSCPVQDDETNGTAGSTSPVLDKVNAVLRKGTQLDDQVRLTDAAACLLRQHLQHTDVTVLMHDNVSGTAFMCQSTSHGVSSVSALLTWEHCDTHQLSRAQPRCVADASGAGGHSVRYQAVRSAGEVLHGRAPGDGQSADQGEGRRLQEGSHLTSELGYTAAVIRAPCTSAASLAGTGILRTALSMPCRAGSGARAIQIKAWPFQDQPAACHCSDLLRSLMQSGPSHRPGSARRPGARVMWTLTERLSRAVSRCDVEYCAKQ